MVWSGWWDSNPRPPDPQPGALPTALHPDVDGTGAPRPATGLVTTSSGSPVASSSDEANARSQLLQDLSQINLEGAGDGAVWPDRYMRHDMFRHENMPNPKTHVGQFVTEQKSPVS